MGSPCPIWRFLFCTAGKPFRQGPPRKGLALGPNLGPGPFWADLFLILDGAGCLPGQFGTFIEISPPTKFPTFFGKIFLHNSPPTSPWRGLTPVKKMRETSENLPKPSKKSSPGTKNPNTHENLVQNGTFFGQLLCCNHTTLREQP